MVVGRRGAAAPCFEIQRVDERGQVTLVTFRGLLTVARVNEVTSALSTTMAGGSAVRAVVFDTSRVDEFEPGVPARIIGWLGAHGTQLPLAVLVTTRPVLLATVRAGECLLRDKTQYLACDSVAAALGIAQQFARERVRATSGVQSTAVARALARRAE